MKKKDQKEGSNQTYDFSDEGFEAREDKISSPI